MFVFCCIKPFLKHPSNADSPHPTGPFVTRHCTIPYKGEQQQTSGFRGSIKMTHSIGEAISCGASRNLATRRGEARNLVQKLPITLSVKNKNSFKHLVFIHDVFRFWQKLNPKHACFCRGRHQFQCLSGYTATDSRQTCLHHYSSDLSWNRYCPYVVKGRLVPDRWKSKTKHTFA